MAPLSVESGVLLHPPQLLSRVSLRLSRKMHSVVAAFVLQKDLRIHIGKEINHTLLADLGIGVNGKSQKYVPQGSRLVMILGSAFAHYATIQAMQSQAKPSLAACTVIRC